MNVRNVIKFTKEGSVRNQYEGRSDHKVSVLKEENLEKMKVKIEAKADLCTSTDGSVFV